MKLTAYALNDNPPTLRAVHAVLFQVRPRKADKAQPGDAVPPG